jgi:hypothetical protein
MTETPVLQRRVALSALPVLALAAASPAAGSVALDDPDSVITVILDTRIVEVGELVPGTFGVVK